MTKHDLCNTGQKSNERTIQERLQVPVMPPFPPTRAQTGGRIHCLKSVNILPICLNVSSRTMTEVINLEITFEGACAILQEGNPMTVYEKLSSYIPGRERKPLEKKKK